MNLWGRLRDAHFKPSFQNAFEEFDQDGNGSITKAELQEAFRNVQPRLRDEELDNLIREVDMIGNGMIEYDEFEQMLYKSMNDSDQQSALKTAFKAFDRDEKGFVSITDFRAVMKELDEPYKVNPSDFELSAMGTVADADSDGHVEYEGFVKMMLMPPYEMRPRFPLISKAMRWLHPILQRYRAWILGAWGLYSVTPAVCWLQKLILICSVFDEDFKDMAHNLHEIIQRVSFSESLEGGHSCDYRTFTLPLVGVVKFIFVDWWESHGRSLGIVGILWGLPLLWEYWQQYQAAVEEQQKKQKLDEAAQARDFSEVVQFSLCFLSNPKDPNDPNEELAVERGDPRRVLSYTTLFEVRVKDLVKGLPTVLKAVNSAAVRTTPEYPLLQTMEKTDWTKVRGMILNALSEKYSQGYVAEELGIHVQKNKFWFGLANEKKREGGFQTSKKLRVILAKESLLSEAQTFMEAGTQPQFKMNNRYFAGRWDTLKNMAQLLKERKRWKNSPLRDIDLAMPGSGSYTRVQ
eukprot:SAG31_NODE_1632_length_7694_cov_12.123239_2_plen_519_part_00